MAEDIKKLQDEVAFLRSEVERLKDELVRMVSRNLDLSERLEWDVDLRRRTQAAREIMEARVERQRNADLQDDGQLMALIEIHVEKDRPHLRPDFGPTQLADMLGVSMTRLYQLFRHQTIHTRPKPISTTCARWPPCDCCAKSPTTPLPSSQRRLASPMSVRFSAAFRMPSACRPWIIV